MSNFISWAIGEVPNKDSMEGLQVPKTEEVKSTVTMENLEVKSKPSSESEIQSLEFHTKDESTSITMELLEKVDSIESEYNGLEKLKLDKIKESGQNTIFTRLTGVPVSEYFANNSDIQRLKVESIAPSGSEVTTLHMEVVTELDKYFSENGIDKSIGSDYNSFVSGLAEILENESNQEPLVNSITFSDYFEKVEDYLTKLNISDELKDKISESISTEKDRVVELLKLETKDEVSDSIEPLEFKIADYPKVAIQLLDKYADSGNTSDLVKELNKGELGSSSASSKDIFEKYAELVKPLSGNVYELSYSAALGLASMAGVNSTAVDMMAHSFDTMYDRFGLDKYLSGINYTVGKFKSYAEIALQILQKSKAGIEDGYFPFSAENLIFAATFWMFLDPLKYTITIQDVGKPKSLSLYFRLLDYYNRLDKDTLVDSVSKLYIGKKRVNVTRLPFKGRSSVIGLEVRDQNDWDIKLTPYECAGSAPPEMTPYNVQWDPGDNEPVIETIHHWLPITDFKLDVSNTQNQDTISIFDKFKISYPNLQWNLKGSLTFLETSRLWFNRWRRDYLRYLYGDSAVFGSTMKRIYQQCCYLMELYIFDKLDAMVQESDKDRFLRKFNLVILPTNLGTEDYSGSNNNLNPTLEYQIVGCKDTTLFKLGELT